MKVSFFQTCDIQNMGSVLVAFATQKILERYADDVDLFSFIYSNKYANEPVLKYFYNLPKTISKFFTIIKMKRYRKYLSKYINWNQAKFIANEDIENFNFDADIYCVGSDVSWNPAYKTHNHWDYEKRYLNFIPNDKRKFSFATSFGIEKIDDKLVNMTRKHLEQFEKVSVREDAGVKILNEQYGYDNAVKLIDPTLVFDYKFWKKYIPKSKIEEDYILVYDLNIEHKREFDKYVKKISNKTKTKIIRISLGYKQIFRCGKTIVLPSMFEFLSLIANAKFVLADSFHGTIFALNFNVEPICVLPRFTPARMNSILSLLNCEHKILKDFNDFDILNRTTDFKHVNKVLEKERKKVDEFLSSIFHKEK